MSDPYLYSVTNAVATFSINDAPWNLMSVDYIDRLEEQLLVTNAVATFSINGGTIGRPSDGIYRRR